MHSGAILFRWTAIEAMIQYCQASSLLRHDGAGQPRRGLQSGCSRTALRRHAAALRLQVGCSCAAKGLQSDCGRTAICTHTQIRRIYSLNMESAARCGEWNQAVVNGCAKYLRSTCKGNALQTRNCYSLMSIHKFRNLFGTHHAILRSQNQRAAARTMK